MAAKMSVLGPTSSYPQYLRSAQGQFPLEKIKSDLWLNQLDLWQHIGGLDLTDWRNRTKQDSASNKRLTNIGRSRSSLPVLSSRYSCNLPRSCTRLKKNSSGLASSIFSFFWTKLNIFMSSMNWLAQGLHLLGHLWGLLVGKLQEWRNLQLSTWQSN